MSNDRIIQARLQRRIQERSRALVDKKGYVREPKENLVEGVSMSQFEEDLRQGDGNELRMTFCAAHSSTALAVNTFAWFRDPERLALLSLLGSRGATELRFEQKCAIFRGGRAPNLDVWIEREHEIVAIESKVTEHLIQSKPPTFSQAYDRLAPPEFAEPCWWQVYQDTKASGPNYLDTAQLVKHYFGLRKQQLSGKIAKPIRFLYLYWEPVDADSIPACTAHRESLMRLTEAVQDSQVSFRSLTYPQLWAEWASISALRHHADNLRKRYEVGL